MSVTVQVFGRRDDGLTTDCGGRRPAAEKRQGTKSREVGHRWCNGRYGDLMAALDLGNSKSGGLESAQQLKRFGTIDAKEGI